MRLTQLVLFTAVSTSIATSSIPPVGVPVNYGVVAVHNPTASVLTVDVDVWEYRNCDRLKLQPELLLAFPPPLTHTLTLEPGEVHAFGPEHDCVAIRVHDWGDDSVFFSSGNSIFDDIYDEPSQIEADVLVLGDTLIETSDMRIEPWAVPACDPADLPAPVDNGEAGIITGIVDDGVCQAVTFDGSATHTICAGPLFPFEEGDVIDAYDATLEGPESRLTRLPSLPFEDEEIAFTEDNVCVGERRGLLFAKSLDTPAGRIDQGDVLDAGDTQLYVHQLGISLVDERRDETVVYALGKVP